MIPVASIMMVLLLILNLSDSVARAVECHPLAETKAEAAAAFHQSLFGLDPCPQ
jgi:hypothetical protein